VAWGELSYSAIFPGWDLHYIWKKRKKLLSAAGSAAVLFNGIKESWRLARKILLQFKLLWFLNVFGNTLLAIHHLEIVKKNLLPAALSNLTRRWLSSLERGGVKFRLGWESFSPSTSDTVYYVTNNPHSTRILSHVFPPSTLRPDCFPSSVALLPRLKSRRSPTLPHQSPLVTA